MKDLKHLDHPTSCHKRLAKWIADRGGQLFCVSQQDFHEVVVRQKDFQLNPFSENSGVFWESKQIVYIPTENVPALIHETGHVFASLLPPDFSDEFDFFGWEYLLSKAIRFPFKIWAKLNSEYIVSWHTKKEDFFYEDFGDIPYGKKFYFLRERIAEADSHGLIGENYKLICLR